MKKVLIVEDDPMVAEINKEYIESIEGFQVDGIFRDGISALKYLEKNKIDLVILDVYMPKLSGISFLMELRKRHIESSVIMVTAAKEVEEIKKSMELGAIDYLIKPFEYERLRRALENYKLRSNLYDKGDNISQGDLDKIFLPIGKEGEKLPKGLNIKTLNRVLSYIESNNYSLVSYEDIAKGLGVTKVTIKKYMNYLEEIDYLEQEVEYGSLGRPSHRYRWKGKRMLNK